MISLVSNYDTTYCLLNMVGISRWDQLQALVVGTLCLCQRASGLGQACCTAICMAGHASRKEWLQTQSELQTRYQIISESESASSKLREPGCHSKAGSLRASLTTTGDPAEGNPLKPDNSYLAQPAGALRDDCRPSKAVLQQAAMLCCKLQTEFVAS